LAGPATLRDTARPFPAVAAVGQYHFGWKLSGNRAVAPLQVFDDGQRTWLQFPAGQPVPAIFARLPHGDQLLAPTAGATGQGGLWMLDGVWPQLMMRGGALQSIALRLPTVADMAADTGESARASGTGVDPAPIPMPTAAPAPTQLSHGVLPVATVPAASPPSLAAHVATGATGALTVAASTPVSTIPRAAASPVSATMASPAQRTPTPSAEPIFDVSPADGTLRAALSRWANTAGWTFAFAHWAVEVDIPIVAAATFPLPFEQAVQELTASTELSDQPVRPCFYTNRVLRIVAHTQPCDRSAAGSS